MKKEGKECVSSEGNLYENLFIPKRHLMKIYLRVEF